METLIKNYKDNEEIELAWKELIEALKPMTKKENTSTKFNSVKTHHHPALITTSELANWEMLG